MLDITALAAWGEFLGGIAVVVSLIYLASQIRQNSRLLQASTASVTQQAESAVSSLVVQDPELARIFWAGLADRAALSEADLRRFDPLIGIQFSGNQQHFRLAHDGLISPEAWADMEQAMRWNAQQPGFQQWWLQWRNVYGGDFKEYLDGLIREGVPAE